MMMKTLAHLMVVLLLLGFGIEKTTARVGQAQLSPRNSREVGDPAQGQSLRRRVDEHRSLSSSSSSPILKKKYDDEEHHQQDLWIGTTQGSGGNDNQSNEQFMLVGMLAGVTVMLFGMFLLLVIPPLFRCIRRRMPINPKQLHRRYETIEGWLITKRVRVHDEVCERICKCYRHPKQKVPPSPFKQCSEDIIEEVEAMMGAATGDVLPGDRLPPRLQSTGSYDTAETTLIASRSTLSSSSSTHSCSSSYYPYQCGEIQQQQPTIQSNLNDTNINNLESGEEVVADEEEDDGLPGKRECPICMEPFRPLDIVSWSPRVATPVDPKGLSDAPPSSTSCCSHVYHHACIKEWLLRHADCPFCRITFLPVDDDPHHLSDDLLETLAHQRASKVASTYYCLEDGLIQLNVNMMSSQLRQQREQQQQNGRHHQPSSSSPSGGANGDEKSANNNHQRKAARTTFWKPKSQSRDGSAGESAASMDHKDSTASGLQPSRADRPWIQMLTKCNVKRMDLVSLRQGQVCGAAAGKQSSLDDGNDDDDDRTHDTDEEQQRQRRHRHSPASQQQQQEMIISQNDPNMRPGEEGEGAEVVLEAKMFDRDNSVDGNRTEDSGPDDEEEEEDTISARRLLQTTLRLTETTWSQPNHDEE